MQFLDGDHHVTLLWSGKEVTGGGSEADMEDVLFHYRIQRDCLPIPTFLAGTLPAQASGTLLSTGGGGMLHTAQDPPALEKGGLWSPSHSYNFMSVCFLSIGYVVCLPISTTLIKFLLVVWVLPPFHSHHG